MTDKQIPDGLDSIESIRVLLAMKDKSLCHTLCNTNRCTHIIRCSSCIIDGALNVAHLTEAKAIVIQVLLDKKFITKGQALELTLDYG